MTTNTGATLGMTNYNENSSPQLAVINSMKSYIHMGLDQLDVSCLSSPLFIADFGSSHGRNSIQAMKIIIEYLEKINKLLTSPIVIHNDLPTNDWTTLFQLLAKDNSYHAVANGHSFYEQCLPSNSLSIGFSSFSVNWLSKIPCKISNNRFYMFADENERQAFKDQAKLDLASFLENRSRELKNGGILLLSIPSVDQQGFDCLSFGLDTLYTCARSLFSAKELSDFAPPVYYRPLSECVDHSLFDRCSLKLIKAELTQVKLPFLEQYQKGQLTFNQYIKAMVKLLQSLFELALRQVLEINGRSNEEIDKLLIGYWLLYEEKLTEKSHLLLGGTPFTCVYLILKKMEVTDN